jgi:hypothetical protein
MLGWLPILMYLATKQIIHPGAVLFSILAVAQRSLSGAPGMSVVVPGLLWFGALRLQRHSVAHSSREESGAGGEGVSP